MYPLVLVRTIVHIFRIASLVILSTCTLLLTRCDGAGSNNRPQPSPSIAPLPKAQDKHVNLNMIELYDLEMKHLAVSALTGDLRPYYMVSGRIQNRTGMTLASVTIRIYLESTEKIIDNREVYDKADIQISGPILGGTKGFSQETQVLPPKGKRWTVVFVIVDAKGE